LPIAATRVGKDADVEFQAETSAFGLIFMLLLFGIATLVMPAFAVEMARERSPWLPFAIGFLLIAVMVDVLSVTQLFDIALPHRDPFLIGLMVAGFGLCTMVWPLMMLAGPFRRITKIGFALFAVLLVMIVAAGAVQALDPVLLWIGVGIAPGPLAAALDLAAWKRPTFGLLAGVTFLVFTVVVATTSVEPIKVEREDGTYSGGFKGGSPSLRKAARAVATIACLAVALYGFSVFFDAALRTSFEPLFRPVLTALETLDTVGEAWDFYAEWAGFLFVAGLVVWYAVSEQQWGCLTVVVLGLAAYFAWAISAGLFEDWGGPLRGAWQAITEWFR